MNLEHERKISCLKLENKGEDNVMGNSTIQYELLGSQWSGQPLLSLIALAESWNEVLKLQRLREKNFNWINRIYWT